MTPPLPKPLKLGETGAHVRRWQRLMNLLLGHCPETGTFDDYTYSCTRMFQANNGLDPSGEVDGATWSKAEAKRVDRLHEESEKP